MDLTELEADRLETAARLLHERAHVVSVGHACDKCRRTATDVARVLWGQVEREGRSPAA